MLALALAAALAAPGELVRAVSRTSSTRTSS